MLLPQGCVSLQKVVSDLVLDLCSSFLGLEGEMGEVYLAWGTEKG